MTSGTVERSRATVRERADAARQVVLGLDGVIDVVIGGSIGRGEEWAFSDIDLTPITSVPPADVLPELKRIRVEMESAWEMTGVSQTLDVGSLTFTSDEAQTTVDGDAELLAARVAERRWLHGTDKAAGGSGAPGRGIGDAFATSLSQLRFDATVRRARFDAWMVIVDERLRRARVALDEGRRDDALTAAAVAGPLAAAVLETWREREGSMTKFATRFERVATGRGATELLAAIASIAMSSTEVVLADVPNPPQWLEARIDLAYAARIDAGETLTPEQNRRDLILLHLGQDSLPNPITRLRQHVGTEHDYVSRVEAIAAQIRALDMID